LRSFQILTSDSVELGWTTPKFFLSAPTDNKIVLCSTAVYGLTASKWLTEWLFYHHFAQEVDQVDLYVMLTDNGPQMLDTLDHLLGHHR
jgi:hypothetical protein